MMTRDWWMALEGISSIKIKKFFSFFFFTLISSQTYITFFHVWSRQLDVLKNVQADLFYTIKMNGDCACQALKRHKNITVVLNALFFLVFKRHTITLCEEQSKI